MTYTCYITHYIFFLSAWQLSHIIHFAIHSDLRWCMHRTSWITIYIIQHISQAACSMYVTSAHCVISVISSHIITQYFYLFHILMNKLQSAFATYALCKVEILIKLLASLGNCSAGRPQLSPENVLVDFNGHLWVYVHKPVLRAMPPAHLLGFWAESYSLFNLHLTGEATRGVVLNRNVA